MRIWSLTALKTTSYLYTLGFSRCFFMQAALHPANFPKFILSNSFMLGALSWWCGAARGCGCSLFYITLCLVAIRCRQSPLFVSAGGGWVG